MAGRLVLLAALALGALAAADNAFRLDSTDDFPARWKFEESRESRVRRDGTERARLAGQESTAPGDNGDDSEGDSAQFMVEVRHADGRACSAALVSMRTALSSAACARPALGGDVWARPAAAPGAVRATRVVRIAYATGGDYDEARGADAGVDPWAGVAADLALLELAEPLKGALAIVMATEPAACAPPAGCQLVRVERAHSPPRLLIVDARLEDAAACAALGPRWPALRARTLCLVGAELCREDWGTGVVCGGKLCGVLSRSAGEGDAGGCGALHAAPGLPRWRRFVHCAHTSGACGRDGDCAQLCRESRLVEAPSSSAPTASAVAALAAAPPDSPSRTSRPDISDPETTAAGGAAVTRTASAPLPAAPAVTRSAPPAAALGHAPAALDFEPNRADFMMSSARSTRVFLKAGEYGDNAAEYGAPDDGAAPALTAVAPVSASAAPPTRSPASEGSPVRTAAAGEPQARVSPAPRPAPRPAPAADSPRAAAPAPSLALPVVFMTLLYIWCAI